MHIEYLLHFFVSFLHKLTIINCTEARAHELAAKFLTLDNSIVELGNELKMKNAVESANKIVTATNSSQPLFNRSWVKAGFHIN